MNTSSTRPNIVVIMADQLAPQFLPCYGHEVVQAPTISRLADEGVVFDAAYTNSPLCAPSRFIMMSGRLPTRIAAWDNAVEFSSEVPTFAHYLAAEGYHSCLSGKMHFVGPDQLHGFDQRLTTDVYPADFTWHPEWDRYQERLDWFHNMEVVTKAGPCIRSMYMDYDDEAVFKARRFLFDRAREGGETPFMLTVSMIQPHDPYLCSEENWNRYREDDIDLPKVPYGGVEEDPHSARLRYGYGANEQDFDETTLRNARRAYYGSISEIDNKVAQVLETIEQAGFADNTIVIFTGDHGDMLGERGMWFKMCYFENSTRVPLIVHAPKMFSPKRVAEAVSLADFLPTLVEMARDGKAGEYATPLEGRSLLPHLSGGSGHDEVIGEYFGEGSDVPLFMIRRGMKKLIYSARDPAQLYDLASDPLERDNLINNPPDRELADAWIGEIEQRYDIEDLSQKVRESQHRRKFLKHIMRKQEVVWDYQPEQRVEREWVRNTMPIYELEKKARFPQV